MLRLFPSIASILGLVLCVALMGMWVRSHYWQDSLIVRFSSYWADFTAMPS
jgi:hypothetical protein